MKPELAFQKLDRPLLKSPIGRIPELLLSWMHYLNAVLHILSQIEQQFFCIYVFFGLFSLSIHRHNIQKWWCGDLLPMLIFVGV